jgi:D-arabinose 1-dehydrogenase-like Zn-dependent alcohol dehydrogenase
MTLGPKISFPMTAVLKNIELRSSTMGSRAEFHDMVSFVAEKKITPIVSQVAKLSSISDLKTVDELFEVMKEGKQFGKLVIELVKEEDEEGQGSKL